MAATEPVKVYSDLQKDYEENRERSGIYKFIKNKIPNFKNNRYNTAGKSTKEFYSQLMLCVNHIYTLDNDKNRDSITCYFILLLDRLIANPKHYSVCVNVKKESKKEKIVPKPAKELQNGLGRLADVVLGKDNPVLNEGQQKKGVSYWKSLLPVILKQLVNDKYEEYKSKIKKYDPDILSKVMTTDTKIKRKISVNFTVDDLKKITDNVAECYVHNSVKDRIYNAMPKVKNGVERAPRNKTIAMLDELAREKNFAEEYDYVAFTDRENIYKMYDEFKDDKDSLLFIPVASDCFGNIVAMANKFRLKYSHVTRQTKHKVFFVVMTHTIRTNHDSPLQIILRSDYKTEEIFLSYDNALNCLRLKTSDYLTESLSKVNNGFVNILKGYRKMFLNRYQKKLPDLTGVAQSKDFENELKKNERELTEEMENK